MRRTRSPRCKTSNSSLIVFPFLLFRDSHNYFAARSTQRVFPVPSQGDPRRARATAAGGHQTVCLHELKPRHAASSRPGGLGRPRTLRMHLPRARPRRSCRGVGASAGGRGGGQRRPRAARRRLGLIPGAARDDVEVDVGGGRRLHAAAHGQRPCQMRAAQHHRTVLLPSRVCALTAPAPLRRPLPWALAGSCARAVRGLWRFPSRCWAPPPARLVLHAPPTVVRIPTSVHTARAQILRRGRRRHTAAVRRQQAGAALAAGPKRQRRQRPEPPVHDDILQAQRRRRRLP